MRHFSLSRPIATAPAIRGRFTVPARRRFTASARGLFAGAALGALAAIAAPAARATETYTLDQAHSFPNFEISHLGYSTYRGRFNKTSGKIVLDRATRSGSVDISIDAASVDTGSGDLDRHLRSATFFNAARHPAMTFRGNQMSFTGDRLSAVSGEFTLLGVTRPLTLKIDHFQCGAHPLLRKPMCGANATASLRRSEYGMTKYLPGIGDEVKLVIQVEAFKD